MNKKQVIEDINQIVNLFEDSRSPFQKKQNALFALGQLLVQVNKQIKELQEVHGITAPEFNQIKGFLEKTKMMEKTTLDNLIKNDPEYKKIQKIGSEAQRKNAGVSRDKWRR